MAISFAKSVRDIFARIYSQDQQPQEPEVVFTSLGLAVLDDISVGGQSFASNVLGGSGTYATMGARLFLQLLSSGDTGSQRSRVIGWQVNAGEDFPRKTEDGLLDWQILLRLRRLPGLLSTRGLLQYTDSTFEQKAFRYTTNVLKVVPADFEGSILLSSQSFHFLARPEDLEVQVAELLRLREEQGLKRPLILWEPAPPSCLPENREAYLRAARLVDAFSPNHLELAALNDENSRKFSPLDIQKMAREFLEAGIGTSGEGLIVVRAGEHGALLWSKAMEPAWLPTFYGHNSPLGSRKIVDATGAGNAFLGGLAIGFLESRDWTIAGQFGTVAASYALEQIGVPALTHRSDKDELWNESRVRDRLKDYQSWLQPASRTQIDDGIRQSESHTF